MAAASTRLVCPDPIPISRRSRTSTIAFDVTPRTMRQARSRSRRSRSLGPRSVTQAPSSGSSGRGAGVGAFYADGLPRTEDPRANAKAYFMTAKLVSSAVLLAATSEPEQLQARFASFIEKGLEIVRKSRRQ